MTGGPVVSRGSTQSRPPELRWERCQLAPSSHSAADQPCTAANLQRPSGQWGRARGRGQTAALRVFLPSTGKPGPGARDPLSVHSSPQLGTRAARSFIQQVPSWPLRGDTWRVRRVPACKSYRRSKTFRQDSAQTKGKRTPWAVGKVRKNPYI